MSLVSKVTERVRAHYRFGSSRYDDSRIRAMAHSADCAVREYVEPTHSTYDIDLLAGVIYYPLPLDMIRVRSVLYSSNGSTFTDGVLKPMVITDLDDTYSLWINNTGNRPEHYGILSTPGTDGCFLVVWMPMASVTSEKVRVVYTSCEPENNTDFESVDDLDDWILDTCHVPHVLSQIYALEDAERFKSYWMDYLDGAEKARIHFANRYRSISPRGATGMSDGQLA